MNQYLTLRKVLIDSIAIFKKHFLYITALNCAVVIPYYYLSSKDNLPEVFTIFIPIFILLNMLVRIVSIKLTASSYLYNNFMIFDELKKNIKKILPFLLISLIGGFSILFGSFLFFIPGIIAMVFFHLLKVHFAIYDKNIKSSVSDVMGLLKNGYFIPVLKINMLPILFLLIFALILFPFINPQTPETLAMDLQRLSPYMTIFGIIIYPISVSFYTSLYFNLVKENQLDSTDQLV